MLMGKECNKSKTHVKLYNDVLQIRNIQKYFKTVVENNRLLVLGSAKFR